MNLFALSFPEYKDKERRHYRGCSEKLKEYYDQGFVFSPFGTESPVYTITPDRHEFKDSDVEKWCEENDGEGNCGLQSVTKERHLTLVEEAKSFALQMEEATGRPSKVIATRVKIIDLNMPVMELFRRLEDTYRDATVFLFSTPISGTWIGASPERLFSVDIHRSRIETMALAGTRPIDSDGEWDQKNIREQKMVTDFISEKLKSVGIDVTLRGPVTHPAGMVEHLCTEINGLLPRDGFVDIAKAVGKLGALLSPTPALCGAPRREAEEFIVTHELNPRGCYGGYLGYVNGKRADMYVNLRSGRIINKLRSIALYAGGGITSGSEPEGEWMETERKLATIGSVADFIAK